MTRLFLFRPIPSIMIPKGYLPVQGIHNFIHSGLYEAMQIQRTFTGTLLYNQ